MRGAAGAGHNGILTPRRPPGLAGLFISGGSVSDLRAAIIVDYQNVHLVGHGLYDATRTRPRHETLIDPLLFAQRLLRVRNAAQKAGMANAVLRSAEVFSGQPSPEHDSSGYARRQAQKAQWERDRRVAVTLRPLKYEYERDAAGRHARAVNGQRIVRGQPQEKGVDVLCALAAVRAAQDPSVDLVIVASSDSDLAPVLDEVRRLGTAKIETFCWWDESRRIGYQIHPSDRSQPVWNTRLGEADFRACHDRTHYR